LAKNKKTEPAAKTGGSEKLTQSPSKASAILSARAGLTLLVMAIFCGGYLTWPHWYLKIRQQLPNLPPIEDARFGGLASRVEVLESSPSKDADLTRMEVERKKLSDAVAELLDQVKTSEDAIVAVRKMAKAAATAEEVARASAELKRLNDRLTQLERAGSRKKNKTKVEDTVKRAAEVEATTADQSNSLEARVNKAISAIEKRIGTLLANPPVALSAASAHQSAMALAVAQLRRTAEGGQPYRSDLDALAVILGDNPKLKAELDLLARSAATGITTISALHRAFSALAGELAAKAGASTSKGWFDRAVARLSSLVRIRRVDGHGDPDATDTIIARAEADLAAGDLDAAVEAVKSLTAASPLSQTVAQQWLARAKARLAVENALTVMHVQAISLLAPAAPKKE